MANITAAQVKELRDKTAAGMMDCKKALTECDGDIEKAVEWLRKNGMSKAEKKASRSTSEGRIGVYIHHDGKQAAMVELLCETDFVAKNEKFLELLDCLCKQVVAMDPKYITKEEIPAEVVAKETDILREATLTEARELIEDAKRWEATVADAEAALAAAEGSDKNAAEENLAGAKKNAARAAGKAKTARKQMEDADFLDMIVKGKVEKALAEKCLMSQEYALGDKETIEQMVKSAIGTIGENIKISRFCRFKIGE